MNCRDSEKARCVNHSAVQCSALIEQEEKKKAAVDLQDESPSSLSGTVVAHAGSSNDTLDYFG